jgi:rhodanese-related sulfurtransferase
VAFELAQQGLDPDRLYALTGGFRAWLEAGLPTVIGTEPGE